MESVVSLLNRLRMVFHASWAVEYSVTSDLWLTLIDDIFIILALVFNLSYFSYSAFPSVVETSCVSSLSSMIFHKLLYLNMS